MHTRSMLALLVTSLVVALRLGQLATALRSGAPSLACMSMRPIHGLHQARPASASQFFVRQSALSYAPGQNVTVEIMTQSSGRHFRGFMVQSYNPLDGKQIGHFVATDEAQPMACASATHRNNQDKSRVSITWVPPSEPTTTTGGGGGGGSSTGAQGASRAEGNASPPPAAMALLNNWLGLPTPNGVQKRHLAASGQPEPQAKAGPVQQVRFRATIVVSYSEFYTGFESSERQFERFDYSPASLSHARGLAEPAEQQQLSGPANATTGIVPAAAGAARESEPAASGDSPAPVRAPTMTSSA